MVKFKVKIKKFKVKFKKFNTYWKRSVAGTPRALLAACKKFPMFSYIVDNEMYLTWSERASNEVVGEQEIENRTIMTKGAFAFPIFLTDPGAILLTSLFSIQCTISFTYLVSKSFD